MTMNECTNTVEEIAGLRRARGVTVLCSGSVQKDAELQLLISGQTSESGRCPCNHNSPLRRRVQLPDKVKSGDDTSSSSLQLCYSRSLGEGSTLSRSIRLRLSSLSRPVQSRSPLTSIGLQYLTTVLLLLIAFPCSKVVASHSIYAKVPLTRTDVTNTHGGYRTFSGRGPNHASPHARSNVGVQPRLSTRSFYPLKSTPPLDFQKLKVIKRWDEFTTDVLLVSGSNYVYMINASQTSTSGEISYLERLQWTSNPNSSSTCIDVGKQEYECKNFIRVVELRQDNTLYVCGTNSYEPKCRIYTRAQFAAATPHNSPYTSEEMCNEQCGCPQNPVTTSVALYTNTSRGFKMFSAAVTDFMGKRSYLVRSGNPSLKSVHKWLNDPSFVKLIEYGEKVYLFFREIPTSVETGADHLTTWSRVAQVCKDDMGGTTVLRYQWTTFLKARLTCSTQGTTSRQEVFHFNNLTSVSDVTRITGSDGRPTDVIFATFTTPWEWSDISMSAVCVYSIQDDIARLFDEGHFMEEQQLRSNPDMTSPMQSGRRVPPPINTVIKKIPLPKVDEPVARPTRCNAGVSNEAEYFAKAHQIMYESVQPRYGFPIFVTESNVRLTQIALDENAGSSETMMLYAGTEDGKMLRIRPRLTTTEGPKSVLIEEMNVADKSACASTTSCGVRALHISHPELPANVSPDLDANPKPSAFIAFTDKMIQVPLTKCDRYPNAACCNFDPECGWIQSNCIPRHSQNSNVLPRISDQIPSNCQKQPVVEPCSEATMNPALIAAICNCNRSVTGRQRHGCRNHNHRNLNTRNDQPIRCRHRPSSRSPVVSKTADHNELNQFFVDRVLPTVGDNFRDTLNSLQHNQKVALLNQLQEALTMTTKLVLRNHRQEYCLPSPAVNSLTHTYPLLLREIELWHSIAYKKMTKEGIPKVCWSGRPKKNCNARISFSVPLAPTLWEPLTALMTNFSAQCDPVTPVATPDTPTTGCAPVPGVDSCKNAIGSNSPHCLPKQCKFSRYAIDVKAFFRHANDSRNFLTDGYQPLWKPVNVTVSNYQAVRRHLEVDVSDTNDFYIQYSPVAEKVKIMFHYIPALHCNPSDPDCTGNLKVCNAGVERTLTSWFNVLMKQLRPSDRPCSAQIQAAGTLRGSQAQYRDRRSFNNEVKTSIPQRCKYIKKKVVKISTKLWSQIGRRARKRGGDYDDIASRRIAFYDIEEVKRFFDNDCSFEERSHQHQTMSTQKRRNRINVKVGLVVSADMPFIIERQPGNRKSKKVKLRFFTRILPSNEGTPRSS
ncbi:uncharacterized protein LOC100176831 isoform X1 [Ciona intestinalis]